MGKDTKDEQPKQVIGTIILRKVKTTKGQPVLDEPEITGIWASGELELMGQMLVRQSKNIPVPEHKPKEA